MNIEEFLQNERTLLRQELQDLKDCQLKYFILSITATGLFLTIAEKVLPVSGAIYLSPLIVILPCWLIYFDKARIISRIVGYYRVLEKMMINQSYYACYGWENSLEKYRKWQQKEGVEFKKRNNIYWAYKLKIGKFLLLKSTHQYWLLSYNTFFLLSVLSLTISISKKTDWIYFLPVSILAIVVAAYNFVLLIHLAVGKYSYDANERYWEEILLRARRTLMDRRTGRDRRVVVETQSVDRRVRERRVGQRRGAAA